MLRKIILVIAVVVVLAGVESLIARQSNDAPAAGQTERQRGGPDRGPGQDRFGGMRAGFDTWFEELTQAYEESDKEKMGQLLEDMKQRRQRFQRGPGSPGRGGPPEGMGRRGPGMPGGAGPSSIESSPLPKTDAEKKILGVLDDMDKNQRRGMMNVPIVDGRLLRLLTETTGAKHVVEIGTSNGYSGIWLCLALQKTGGKLTTHEINAERAALARENFKRAGVDKLVTLVEGDAHETVSKIKEPIDILFLDADKEGYIDYLNKLLPLVRPGGLVAAHNINPRQGDPRYIEAITTNPDLETIFYTQGGGVSVTLKKR
jgi:caffeoyl-CoA O-methyltransferase